VRSRAPKGGALVVVGDPIFAQHHRRIIELALRSQVPSVFGGREFVAAGGLLSYLSSNTWHWRTAAGFVDKISQGREARRSPCGAADEVRAGDQPEYRKGTRNHYSAIAAAACGPKLSADGVPAWLAPLALASRYSRGSPPERHSFNVCVGQARRLVWVDTRQARCAAERVGAALLERRGPASSRQAPLHLKSSGEQLGQRARTYIPAASLAPKHALFLAPGSARRLRTRKSARMTAHAWMSGPGGQRTRKSRRIDADQIARTVDLDWDGRGGRFRAGLSGTFST